MSSSEGAGGNPSEQDVTSPQASTTTQQSDNSEALRDLRSSSPAVKRPASDMGDDISDDPRRDADLETPSGSEINDLDTVENTPRAKQSNRRPRHKRETSVDMLGEDEIAGSNSTSNSTTDLGSATDNPTPSSASTQTNSARSSGNPKGSKNATGDHQDTLSLDERVGKVITIMSKPLEEGQKGYAVTGSWLIPVLARSSHHDAKDPKFDKVETEGDIRPLDNSDLVLVTDPSLPALKDEAGDPYVPFRPGLVMGDDFEMVTQEAWDMIMDWYGLVPGSPVITRYVRNTNAAGDIENNVYELFPPILTILKLPSPNSTSQLKPPDNQKPIRTLVSRQTPFNSWLKEAKQAAGIDLQTKVRVWRILSGLGGSSGSGVMTPVASRSASPAPGATLVAHAGNSLVLELNSFLSLQEGSQRESLEAIKDQTANEKYNGNSTMEMAGIGRDDVVVLDEQIGGPGGGEWTSESAKAPKKTNLSIPVTKSGVPPKSKAGTSGRSSPAPGAGGIMTRGRQRRDGKPRGITGLSNLGNTCYMNSALQCVRSVEELTQYFLLDRYKEDLNPDNPLGYHGDVAKAYANLLTQIYSETAAASFAPRQIKQTIGRYGSSFSGYGQQDSQEFLGFLLDGLTEDLNRVKKKPYVEKPDSTDEMVHDPVALREMADKCWDIYKARSDSVVTDLFGGMYKSTVVCPVCDKVSIIFDPFNNLTLQIPVENLWTKEIFYFPLHQRPVRVGVDIDKNASVLSLKQYVAKKMASDPKKLVMTEIYKNRFYKMFDNLQSIAEAQIGSNDDIAIFELEDVPTNYLPDQPSKPRFSLYSSHSEDNDPIPSFDSPKCDRMLVPIFNRTEKANGGRGKVLFGAPSYTIITRQDAQSIDAITKKVLAEVATLTTRDLFHEDQDGDSEDGQTSTQEDPDTVVMSEEDYSSSDSKVQAGSVESEDGLVDVSMRDDIEATQTIKNTGNPRRRSLPHMLRPEGYIPPQLQNLFQIKVFKPGNETVPTGWSAVDEHKEYTPIMSRSPAVQQRPNPSRRPLLNGDDSSRSSDEDVDDPPEPVHRRLPNADDSDYETSSQPKNDSDSSNEELPTVQTIFHNGNRFNGRNSRGQLTYSKKGKNAKKQQLQDTGPYIRPGEGIVLEWNYQTYDALFGGNPLDSEEMRGCATWTNIDIFPDPELDKKRQMRQLRRKKGFSLDDCLDEFGKAEILSENDAWYCPRCKEHRRASKKFELWKAPDILVVHFKRFSANRGFRDKLDLLVDFPVEGLDLSERVAMHEDKSLLYDLIAVDNHYGGLGGGHYTAFAKNFVDGNWYEYNDSHVSRRQNPGVVVTHAAYLLFYRRRSDVPLGGPKLEEIVGAAHKAVDSDSQPDSRSESPSGEGLRLDGSSRNGSSSALPGVGAAHQAGDGGSEESAGVPLLHGPLALNDDELPSYHDATAETIEGMDVDDDEGLGGMYHEPHGPGLPFEHPGWGFDLMNSNRMQSQMTAVPPGSENDNDGDDMFDGNSNKAASVASEGSDAMVRMVTDFGDDQGTLEGQGFDSTPHQTSPMGSPGPIMLPRGLMARGGGMQQMQVVPSQGEGDDDDDLPVVELQPPSE